MVGRIINYNKKYFFQLVVTLVVCLSVNNTSHSLSIQNNNHNVRGYSSTIPVDSSSSSVTRRKVMGDGIRIAWLIGANAVVGVANASSDEGDFEHRNRDGNKNALIRDDFWYFYGKRPPRVLTLETLPSDDPKWNAWGACAKSESTGSNNSCTYVPLQQRYEGYSKYSFSIQRGVKDFESFQTKQFSKQQLSLLSPGGPGQSPSNAVDALLKGVLLASSLLVTPNFTGPQREVLLARFYLNEAAYATQELRLAIESQDFVRAQAAWEFGRDSWNSYFVIINPKISPKVGEKFILIS